MLAQLTFWESVGVAATASLTAGLITAVMTFIWTSWRMRQVPRMYILHFGISRRHAERVAIPESLGIAISKFYRVTTRPQGIEVNTNEIEDTRVVARDWLKLTRNTAKDYADIIRSLKEAESENDKIEAVRQLLANPATTAVVGDPILRGEVSVPSPATEGEPKLQVELRPHDEGGSLWLVFSNTQYKIAGLVEAQPFRKARFEPYINLLVRLETKQLAALVKDVLPILSSQREYARTILKETIELSREHDRWTGSLSVTNLGKSPIVLDHRDAKFTIKSDDISNIEAECLVLERRQHLDREDALGWSAVQGLLVIPPGRTFQFATVTKKAQGELDKGKLIRTAFDSGNAMAVFSMPLVGQSRLARKAAKSEAAEFRLGTKDEELVELEQQLISEA